MSNFSNVGVAAQDSMSIDAFFRWRVSNPTTLFDSKQLYDNLPLVWDDQEVSGSGTASAYSQAGAKTGMSVSANTAGKRVRQTFMRFNYQPGKSQLVFLTSRMSGAGTGITAQVGQFDDDNGIYFEAKDGVLNAVIRSSTSGSAVDTKVAQSAWNGDKLDGTGPSGHTLDPTMGSIMFLDYEWLGFGKVRVGFVIDELPHVCHTFYHANMLDSVYMTTPNNPLRYSIENDGTGAATSMDHVCSTVISEGGNQEAGMVRYVSTAGTEITATSENVIYALVGIKLKAANVSATVEMIAASVQLQTASETGEWTLRLNPTVAGTFTYSNITNSSLMSALGATANTVTGGTIIQGDFGESAKNATGTSNADVHNAIRLGSAIDGTVDELVLCWMPNGGTSAHKVEGALTWRESL